MPTNIAPVMKMQFFDNNGVPLAGGKLFSYQAGSTTKVTTYTDETGGTPNANPIILDANGRCDVWLTPNQAYKFTLSPSTDTDPPTNPIWTVDNISSGIGTSSYAPTQVNTNFTTTPVNHQRPIEASGTITITLLAASAATPGYQVPIVNVGTGVVTVNLQTGTDTLNGTVNGTMLLGPQQAALFSTNALANGYETLYTVGVTVGSTSAQGIISPAQITASQNDYTPAGLANASVLRLSSSARWNLTGLAGGSSGRTMVVHNVGTFSIVFTFQDVLSAAANRFAFGHTLGGGQSLEIQYDGASSLWRAKSKPEPLGTIKEFAGPVPNDFLAIDQNVSRTTYAALFNEIGTVWGAGDGATTFGLFIGNGRQRIAAGMPQSIEVITNQTAAGNAVPVASNNSKWITGMQVTVSGASGFTGLTNGTWWIVRVDATHVQFATSLANAQNFTVAAVTGTGSATLAWTGSTRVLGEVGGEEGHAMNINDLISHLHGGVLVNGGNNVNPTGGIIIPVAGNTGSTGGNQPSNIMSPFSVVNVGVKFC